MAICKLEIPYKFPSFNGYVYECRRNRYSGAKLKKQIETDISYFINTLPRFEKPITIHFHWVEGTKRRDLDNISYAKKFILDCMVKCHRLRDDNRKCVTAFTDTFSYGKETKVILEIKELDNDNTKSS